MALSFIASHLYFHTRVSGILEHGYNCDQTSSVVIAEEFIFKISGTHDAEYVSVNSDTRILGWVRDGELWLIGNIRKDYDLMTYVGAVPITIQN